MEFRGPNSSFRVFRYILRENLNELINQPNICIGI